MEIKFNIKMDQIEKNSTSESCNYETNHITVDYIILNLALVYFKNYIITS